MPPAYGRGHRAPLPGGRRGRRGRPHHQEVGHGFAHGASKDAITNGKAVGAGADLVDHPGEVVSEAGRQTDPELGRHVPAEEHNAPVHRVQAGGRNPDSDLSWFGVGLGDLPQFQDLGTSEGLIDDGTAHADFRQIGDET